MSFLDLVKKRSSIRDYLDKPVPDSLLESILEAGRWAPSACNIQPWIFIVKRDKASRQAMEKVYNREWFLKAPMVIALCCDRSVSWKRSDGKDFGDIDIAIALDHMTLAAAEAGLGTCWVGNFNPDNAREALALPQHFDPVVLTPLGYPDTPATRLKSRKSLDTIIHWEYYGGKKR
ncbi:MAG: nitroreductase family protein [Chitinispirillaceae bacterium]|nr:nitroreductase family protein [Chitinispirillaceae bacterium]